MREIISACEYLHSLSPPIIHRDIKPENILLDANDAAKLADFGWSNFFNDDRKRKTYCGTPEYLAPEMIGQAGHDESLDLWNLGVLMFELLTGKPPFEGGNQQELFANIKRVKINFPRDFSKLAKDLVIRLLKANPKQRISLEEMKNHPWFKANPPIRTAPLKTKHTLQNGTPLPKTAKVKSNEYEVVSQKSLTNRKETKTIKHKFDEQKEAQDAEEDKSPLSSKKHKKSPKTDTSFKELDEMASPSKAKTAQDKTIEELSTKLQKMEKVLNAKKVSYEMTIRELDKANHDILEYKEMLSKGNKAFKGALHTKELNEEVQRLRSVKRERDQLLLDIESKEASIREYETKLKLSENECDIIQNKSAMLGNKLSETEQRAKNLEKKHADLKKEFEKYKNDKDIKEAELLGKIKILNYEMVNKTAQNIQEGGENMFDNLVNISKDMLVEIRDKVKHQATRNTEEEELREQLLQADTEITKLRTKYETEIFELQSDNQKKLDDLRSKLEKEMKMKLKEKESKIDELRRYISGSEKSKLEKEVARDKLESLEKQYNFQMRMIDDYKLEIGLLKQEQGTSRNNIKDLNAKIHELEYQLAVHKDKAFKILEEEDIDVDESITTAPTKIQMPK
jgi:hypothetical protein